MSIAEHEPHTQGLNQVQSRSTLLLGAGVVLAADRAKAGAGRRRAVAQADEDAVTLAVEAAALALGAELDGVGTIILATDTPVYQEGGAVQLVAELLGLQGDVFALELQASRRDGLAAVRLAAALAREDAPALVCVAHAGGDRAAGDGAVALLLGAQPSSAGDSGELATLTPAASSAIEIRDRWRLPGDDEAREADRSFTGDIGTRKLGEDLLGLVPPALAAPPIIVGPDPRASSALQRSRSGPPDTVTAHVGVIGAAHPLLCMLAALDQPATLVASIANGLGEVLHVAATPAGAAVAAGTRDLAEHGGRNVDRPAVNPTPADFDPFSSGPRAWRDRDVDLRLHGIVGPPAGLQPVPGRRNPVGTVHSWTNDHVYPGAKTTEMATVTMDDGGQFYGQVAMGEHVAIGDRVQLVPRRLHHGGGMVQYFWKVTPCR